MKEITIDGVTYTACTNKFCSDIDMGAIKGAVTLINPKQVTICTNTECENWQWEGDYGLEDKLRLDHTNCRIHMGSELLDGDCSDYKIKEK